MGIPNAIAETPRELHANDSVNEVALDVTFHFREDVETVDSFKTFDTLSSGFDRTKPLAFQLQGVPGDDRPLFYKAIDDFYQYGKDSSTYNSEFDVDVLFQRGVQPYRQLSYSDCQVKFYDVSTETDLEEPFNNKTKFAYVDTVQFDCRGFALSNPTYKQQLEDKVTHDTEEALKNIDRVKEMKKTEEAIKAEYTLTKILSHDLTKQDIGIPSWIEQDTKWYLEGQITEQDYRNLMQYLLSKWTL